MHYILKNYFTQHFLQILPASREIEHKRTLRACCENTFFSFDEFLFGVISIAVTSIHVCVLPTKLIGNRMQQSI